MNNKMEKNWAIILSVVMLSIALIPQLIGAERGRVKRSESDQILEKGFYDSVSAMLIEESDMVKDAQGKNAAAPQGYVDKPSAVQNLMYSGLDDVLDEKFEEAIPKLEKVLDAEPTYLSVWSTLGWTYWRVDRIDDAISLWQKLLALDEDNPLPHELLGSAYVGTSDLGKAEKHLKRSIELDPTSVDSRLILSQVYRWTARYQASIKLLKGLLAEFPDRLDIQNELAMSLYHNSDYEEALPLLSQGVRADPDNKELVLAHARCLLHTGHISEAELRAKRMLKENDKPDLELLLLLADAPRYKDVPEEAVPFLEKIASETDDPEIKKTVMRRLIGLYVLLWDKDTAKYPLDKAIDTAEELVEMEPDHIPWQQTLGELLLMDTRYVKSEETLKNILKNGNTNSLRAHVGLCEIYQATKRFGKAEEEFEATKAFNSKSPFFYHMQARMEMSRANIKGAYDAADKLETAGSHGAVAVLLYNGLSSSDWDDHISARRFRLHILALKQAGFKFLTPDELHQYFADLEPPPSNIEEYVPERAVIITFDNPNPRTMELATEVANDFDIRFAVNVSVGLVNDGNMGPSGWEMLRKYANTDRWVFGSMLYESATLDVISEDGVLGSILSNRLWVQDNGDYESTLDFYARLRDEYYVSRKKLRKELGKEHLVNFMAYPHGELGQGDRSNVKDAISRNLYESGVNYEMGFIQTEFGYAVNGDNPLLYNRYIPSLLDSGDDVVEHVLISHPVSVARKLKIDIATLDGRLYRTIHGLEILRRDNYPERAYESVETFVYDHLPMRFGMSLQSVKSSRGELDLEISHPYAGMEFDWFSDSLHRRNWHTRGKAGFSLTSAINLEARSGYGEFKQSYDENLADADQTPVLERREVKMREHFVGGRIGIRHNPKKVKRSPISMIAGLEKHYYRGDVEFDEWNYMADFAVRPWLPVDMRFQFEHEMVASARSVKEGVAYDMYGYNGAYLLKDWWQLWNNFNYYDVNDGNGRFHAELTSLWEVYEEMGLNLGIAYDYVDAKHHKEDYWTPYRLNECWVVAKLRKNINEFYYDLTLKIGMAKEDIRPEDEIAYLALVDSANRFKFDPGPAPDSEWIDVFSVSCALRKNLGRHWQAYCEGSYNEAPNYHEYRTLAGISLIF